jgi:hypothetical protein
MYRLDRLFVLVLVLSMQVRCYCVSDVQYGEILGIYVDVWRYLYN